MKTGKLLRCAMLKFSTWLSITAIYTDTVSIVIHSFTRIHLCVCMCMYLTSLLVTLINPQLWKFKYMFLIEKNVPFRSFQHNFVSHTHITFLKIKNSENILKHLFSLAIFWNILNFKVYLESHRLKKYC